MDISVFPTMFSKGCQFETLGFRELQGIAI